MSLGRISPRFAIPVITTLLLTACAELTPSPSPASPTPTVGAVAITSTPTVTPTAIPTPTPLATATAIAAPPPTATTPSGPSPTIAPTETPEPVAVDLQSTTFGYSIRYLSDWEATEAVNPRSEPLLYAEGPLGLRRLFVFLNYRDQLLDVQGAADLSKEGFASLFGDLDIVAEEEVILASGTAALIYTFDVEAEVPRRIKILVTVRGNQMWEIFLQSARADFELQGAQLDDVLTSFNLQEPTPYGLAREDTLTLLDQFGPATLDPHLSGDAGSHRYVVQIFSGLVRLDRDLVLTPDLAESWDMIEDGTVFLFQLRDDVTFHSGRPVTAEDFKWSLERATDPDTRSRTASTYLGDIVGVTAKLAGQASEISGVQVVSPTVLRIEIDAPKSYFLSKLTYPTAYVVDQENVEAGGVDWYLEPNGTGPFQLKAWDDDRVLVLERFDDYYRGPAGVANVVFRLHGGFPLRMYESGEIDVAELDASGAEEASEPGSPFSQALTISSELSVSFIGFNTSVAPFDNPKVRQAFLLAMDQQALLQEMDTLFQQAFSDTVAPARGILPPGMPGYNTALETLSFDVVQAQALLAETEYADGNLPSLIFTTVGATGTASIMAQMWNENLGANISVFPLASFAALKESTGNLYDFGWVADYPDPQNFLDALFHSSAEFNYGRYQSIDFDALMDSAAVETDQTQRLLLYQQAERLLLDDAIVAPLWHGVNHVVVQPYVKGWILDAQGLPRLYDIRLER